MGQDVPTGEGVSEFLQNKIPVLLPIYGICSDFLNLYNTVFQWIASLW